MNAIPAGEGASVKSLRPKGTARRGAIQQGRRVHAQTASSSAPPAPASPEIAEAVPWCRAKHSAACATPEGRSEAHARAAPAQSRTHLRPPVPHHGNAIPGQISIHTASRAAGWNEWGRALAVCTAAACSGPGGRQACRTGCTAPDAYGSLACPPRSDPLPGRKAGRECAGTSGRSLRTIGADVTRGALSMAQGHGHA